MKKDLRVELASNLMQSVFEEVRKDCGAYTTEGLYRVASKTALDFADILIEEGKLYEKEKIERRSFRRSEPARYFQNKNRD